MLAELTATAIDGATKPQLQHQPYQLKTSGWGCSHIERGNMYFLIALVLLLLHLLFLPIYLYLTWHHRYWYKRGLVTAQPLTLLGTYPGILTRSCNLVQDVQRVYDKYKGKHRVVGVFVTRQPQLLVLDPQLAHEVLVSDFRSYRDTLTSSYIRHAKLDKYVQRNPFWASGESWRSLRSDGQAGITQHRLKQAYDIWQQSGKLLTSYMTAQAAEQHNILETRDLCFRYTAHVMADFIWGIEAGTLSQSNEPNKLQQMASRWTSYTFYMISIFMAFILAPCCRLWLRLRFFPKDTDDFFSQLTKESIELRLSSAAASKRCDYMSHLLQLQQQKQATHDDLVGHALTLLLDGYDTTATVLLHTLYYVSYEQNFVTSATNSVFPKLAEHGTAQQKLRKEILSNLKADKSMDIEQLCGLPYLEQCVYESLRLSSLIPQYTKICTSPTSISLNATKTLQVERGIAIMIPNYQFHHDKQYFPEPDVFKPERFDNAAHLELIKQGILLPFSDGPRICMGQRLALLTLKSALLHILSNFQIMPSKEKVTIAGDSGFGIVLQGNINLEFRPFDREEQCESYC